MAKEKSPMGWGRQARVSTYEDDHEVVDEVIRGSGQSRFSDEQELDMRGFSGRNVDRDEAQPLDKIFSVDKHRRG